MSFTETVLLDAATTFIVTSFILYRKLADKDKQITDLRSELLLLKLTSSPAKKA